MPPDSSFPALLERLQAGDQEAAGNLVREFEPEVRRFIHFHLSSASVRRFVDSFDLCQSVLVRFFVSFRKGHFDLSDRKQLLALLLTMARNRIYDAVSEQHAARRDARRNVGDARDHAEAVADPNESPSQQAVKADLLTAVLNRLSPEDRPVVERRLLGDDWQQLAKDFQMSPEAVRKRASRAIDNAARELGLLE